MEAEKDSYQIIEDNDFSGHQVSEPNSAYQSEKDFTTLVAWRDCRAVKLYCYKKITPGLPASEKFNLKSQIERASISTTANIAEGYGRFHFKESVQYYRISRGSLFELKDHLLSCKDLHYIESDMLSEGIQLIEKAKVSLNGFINLERSKYEKR